MIEYYNQFILLTSLQEKSATVERKGHKMELVKNVTLLWKRNRQSPIYVILKGI